MQIHTLGSSNCRKYCRYESLSGHLSFYRHCSLTLCRLCLSLCGSTAHCVKASFKVNNSADFGNVSYLTQRHSWWLAVCRVCHSTGDSDTKTVPRIVMLLNNWKISAMYPRIIKNDCSKTTLCLFNFE